MKTAIYLLFNLLFCINLSARVDTVFVQNSGMQQSFGAIVITPKHYKKHKAYPVVYLLHGYSGNYRNWITKADFLQQLASVHQMIIVCPDGGYSSWYFDSPIDSNYTYKTYIGKEVVAYIDKHYATIQQKTARGITGLSMGGHGALYIASSYTNTFGACGSMSGGVNLYASKNKFDIAKRIGDTIHYKSNWINLSATTFLPAINKADSLSIMIDCGLDDFFYESNINLHQLLVQKGVSHDFVVRPGAHNREYGRMP